MDFFWPLLWAALVIYIVSYAVRAAFVADSKQRKKAAQMIGEIEKFLRGNHETPK